MNGIGNFVAKGAYEAELKRLEASKDGLQEIIDKSPNMPKEQKAKLEGMISLRQDDAKSIRAMIILLS